MFGSMPSGGVQICGSTFATALASRARSAVRLAARCTAPSAARRHLNFFQHEAYLSARVPRVICAGHGVRQVRVPWAGGF